MDEDDDRQPRPRTPSADILDEYALLLIDQLPDAIAAAQTMADASAGPLSTARFLQAWRDALVENRPLAASARWVLAAIPRVFSACETYIVAEGGLAAIGIRGPAAAALQTTLRLMDLHDRALGTEAGRAAMTLMLAEIARSLPPLAPEPSRTVH
jgi:hypothetical protein